MKTLAWVGLASLLAAVAACGSDGAQGPAGAAGEKGDSGDPTFGAVVPSAGFLDREDTVVVTAIGTKFDANAPQLDFGAGVKAADVQVISPTSVAVKLTIDKAAPTGPRDVKITTGGKTVTGAKAFVVGSPIAVSLDKPVSQGGLGKVTIKNLDRSAAFGGTDNLKLEAPGLQANGFLLATATDLQALVLAEPTASGKAAITLSNMAGDQAIRTFLSGPEAIAYQPRTPTQLVLGTPKTGENLAKPLDTGLYKLTNDGAGIVELAFTVKGSDIQPGFYFLPASGKFADTLRVTSATSIVHPVAAGGQDYYVIVTDQAGAGGSAAKFGYEVSASRVNVTATSEAAGAHGTVGTAQDLATLPALVTGARAADGELDVYKITLATAKFVELAVNREANVKIGIAPAAAGDPDKVDLTKAFGEVEPVFASRSGQIGKPGASIFDPPTALDAGTYYVYVTSGDPANASWAKPATGKYTFSIRLK